MVWLIVAGIASGVLAGMGMGGGTVFIPLLTQVFGLPQHLAQWINLVAFVPMAVISLLIHARNGLLNGIGFVSLVVPAGASAVVCSLLSVHLRGALLALLFAVLLMVMGVSGFVATLVSWRRSIRAATPIEPPDMED